MYAQLGARNGDAMQFKEETSFTGFNTAEEAYYAEHALINRKAILQPTGVALKIGNVEMMLRQDYCDIKSAMALLRQWMTGFEPLVLLWGTGEVEGKFVITNMGKETNQQFSDGALVACTLTITLKEWANDDVPARKDAPAVAKPENKKAIVNKPSCNTRASSYYYTIQRLYNDILRLLDKSVYCSDQYIKCFAQDAMEGIIIDLQKMGDPMQSLLQEIQLTTSCLYADGRVKTAVDQLVVKVGAFKSFAEANRRAATDPIPNCKIYADNMGDYVKQLKGALQQYINGNKTRK